MQATMQDDRARIREIYAATSGVLAVGDIGTLSEYYVEDAIQFPPDRPPLVGWRQIGASLEKELEGISFYSTVDLLEIVVVGDCAYAWGHFQATVSSETGQKMAETSGSFLDILRRQLDGSWKIARSAWSNHQLAAG